LTSQKVWRPLFLILLWLASAYFLAAPILRPRGLYGWGHYRLIDVYFGIPCLLLAVCLTLSLFVPETKRRQFTFKLVALLASVLITITVLDLGYAFIVDRGWKPAHTDVWFDSIAITSKDNLPDDELGFARKPRVQWQGHLRNSSRLLTYRTDENGFRNPLGITKADVVFIGDSFTEAGSVSEEETFAQQFQAQTKLSVVNLGRGYYGPQQELIVLKRYGFKYDPRLVVWQIFEGNDLTDATRFAKWKATPDQHDSILLRYTKHSIIGNLLARTIPVFFGSPRMFEDQSGQTGQLFLDYPYLPDEPAREPLGMAETRKAIEEGYNLCQSHGVKLLVIFIPIKVRVMGPYVRFNDANDKNSYLPGGKQDSDTDFGSEVWKLCTQLDCPFLDMTDALRRRAAEDNRKIYSTAQDSHLDTDGHVVVAQTLAEWIRSNPRRTQSSAAGMQKR
jgi:hypothetical protein